MKFRSFSCAQIFIALFLLFIVSGQVVAENDGRPNILIIVADDLALTDLGSFGGEIQTPNMDRMALEGVRFTRFYANPSCSPTRATLLTGVDHHLAGLASMQHTQTPAQIGRPGYEGYLNERVVTIPTLLKAEGYQTFMAGKWHLGMRSSNSPEKRGFERSFALLPGGGGHFTNQGLSSEGPAQYRQDGRLVDLPKDFYSSKFYSDQIIKYLKQRDKKRPFFAYLSYTAPHWPLQAPKSTVKKYNGRYSQGYEVLHRERRQRAKLMGLHELVDDFGVFRDSWELLATNDKEIASRTMEVYAAMVDDMDFYLGNVLDLLREEGILDNTLVMILSDNGAEGHDLLNDLPQIREYVRTCCDNSLDNIGNSDSYVSYGHDWARAGVGSFRGFKARPLEGGVRVPLIIRYPALVDNPGALISDPLALEDIVPGLLELAGVKPPAEMYDGRAVFTPSGKSFLPKLSNSTISNANNSFTLVRELFGRVAVWHEDWKLLRMPPPHGDGNWKLYNLKLDAGESRDLAELHPRKVREMTMIWEEYKVKNGVLIPEKSIVY